MINVPKSSYTDSRMFCAVIFLVISFILSGPNAHSAPFPAQFEPRTMTANEGRLFGGSDLYAYLGERVSGLGDINGDGFADFVIGGHREGESYESYHLLIYGSASQGSLNFDAQTLSEESAFTIDGALQATAAGDFNDDGFDDWVFRSGNGEFSLVAGQAEPYSQALDFLDPATRGVGRVTNSAVEDSFPEWRFTAAGDMNGDGIDDLVIDDESYLWFVPGAQDGSMQPLDLGNYTRHRLPSGYFDISAGFDINDDGFDDVVIGMGEAEFYEGQVVILFGGTTEYPIEINRSTLNGQNGMVIESLSAVHSFRLGSEALFTQDVNDDGIADILLSARDAVYVLYGRTQDWPAFLDIDSMTDTDGYTVTVDEDVPNNLAALGDINGDNQADWAVEVNGELMVVYGSGEPRSSTTLSSINPAQGFRLKHTLDTDEYRVMASYLGDVNGDGVDDTLIGDEYGYSVFDYYPGISEQEIELRASRLGVAYLVFGRERDPSPSSPSELGAVIGPDLIDLRWQPSPDPIDSYQIRRDDELVGNVTGDTLFFIDDDVVSDEVYEYQIMAVSSGLLSSPLKLVVVNSAARFPSISGSVYSQTVAEIFWAYENVEYTVYRDNVPVDVRWAASYLDGDYDSAGHTYHISVVPDDSSSITIRSRALRLPDEAGVQLPQRPENLDFMVYSDSTLELFWERSGGGLPPLQYRIFVDDVLLGTTDGNSFLDSTLTSDRTLRRYEVFAIDSTGNQSAPARTLVNVFNEQKARKPAKAAQFSTTFLTANSLRLSWDLDEVGTLPTNFEIRRDGMFLGSVTEQAFTDNTVSENLRYVYTIESIDTDGNRSETARVVVETPGRPFAPDEVTAAVYAPNLLEIFWSRARGAATVYSYDIYKDGQFLLNTPFLSYTDRDVQPGGVYHYVVVSVAAGSRSEPTPAVRTSVPPESYWTALWQSSM